MLPGNLLEYPLDLAAVLNRLCWSTIRDLLEYSAEIRWSTLRIVPEYPTDLAGVPNMNHTVAIKVCWI